MVDKDVEANNDSGGLWRNRRRMGYISLIGILAATAYAMSPWMEVDRLKALETVLTWYYTALASVIASYMGFTTWAYVRK